MGRVARPRIMDPKTGQLLREHFRLGRRRHVIRDEDRPTSTPVGTVKLLARAATCGPNVGALCQTLQQREGQLAVRRIQGVLALAKKHSPSAVDTACAEALELGSRPTASCAATSTASRRRRSRSGRSTRSSAS